MNSRYFAMLSRIDFPRPLYPLYIYKHIYTVSLYICKRRGLGDMKIQSNSISECLFLPFRSLCLVFYTAPIWAKACLSNQVHTEWASSSLFRRLLHCDDGKKKKFALYQFRTDSMTFSNGRKPVQTLDRFPVQRACQGQTWSTLHAGPCTVVHAQLDNTTVSLYVVFWDFMKNKAAIGAAFRVFFFVFTNLLFLKAVSGMICIMPFSYKNERAESHEFSTWGLSSHL